MPMQVYQETPTPDPDPDPHESPTFPFRQPQQPQNQPTITMPVPFQQTMEFITKIGQVILRARVGPLQPATTAYMDVLALMEHPEFWRTSMPLNVDIYLAENRTLLERWVISYQPPHSSIGVAAAAAASRYAPVPPAADMAEKRKADLTDLILLVQALYSYIRLMPLHGILADASLEKNDLDYCVSTADGCPLSPPVDGDEEDTASDASERDSMELDVGAGGDGGGTGPITSPESMDYLSSSTSSNSSVASSPTAASPSPIAFDLSAKLKVYKFRSASTANSGKLHLSVVYDSSVAGMVPVSVSRVKSSKSPIKSPVKRSAPPIGGGSNQYHHTYHPHRHHHHAAASTLSAPPEPTATLHVRSATAYPPPPVDSSGKPPRPTSAPAPSTTTHQQQRRASASLGSPFPSPTMQKRVMGFAHWKLAGNANGRSPSASAGPPKSQRDPMASHVPPPGSLFSALAAVGQHVDSTDNEASTQFREDAESNSDVAATDQHDEGRPIGIPFAEPMRYRPVNMPGQERVTSLPPSSATSLASRKPDLRITIPPLDDDFVFDSPSPSHHSSHTRSSHRYRYHDEDEDANGNKYQHHQHGRRKHHHHHERHHNPDRHRHTPHHHLHSHHHHHHHHHTGDAMATSPTTTIRSINIPLPKQPTSTTSSSTMYLAPPNPLSIATSNANPNVTTSSDSLFGALVGSYEESILSGRMSALPSKPIRFIAEIGVMAHGKCPPGLRCPPHVSAPFDAFFYEVGEEETVTPYVGSVNVAAAAAAAAGAATTASGEARQVNKKSKNGDENEEVAKTRFLGYRIPPKGQLQIVIKNPSRTVIKLFLLPYDFHDMPPHTKTILRQKSYSTPTTTTLPHSTATTTPPPPPPQPALPSRSPSTHSLLPTSSTPPQRHLRYAIHVPVYRTRKSVYLGPQLRVVFAHRRMESDEKCEVVCERVQNPPDTHKARGDASQPTLNPATRTTTATNTTATTTPPNRSPGR
ncbi:hypothetical protein PhCBS80983_g05909 [Powellomyces hirtus]|uniref:Atos-like conserved domain-containing protein n=1 Tax=Powellomyces hirtus TaxID=109895 RepID=A0A507DTF3_9FUNG|nr:hypothetical protein PhCBS80983_g05909 [Powellomyces hirtus]